MSIVYLINNTTVILGKGLLTAVDVTRPENSALSKRFNITGFPTLIYFEGGQEKYPYPGDNTKTAIMEFMRSPTPEAPKQETEAAWKDEPSEAI